MNTLLCNDLLEHVLVATEDPALLDCNLRRVCKLWYSLVEHESFWKQLFYRVFLFSTLKTSTENWKAACLRLGMMTPEQRTEALLTQFDGSSDLQNEVRSMFASVGHTYFPYFAPLHKIYPGGYALLLFKINKLDTQQSMAQRVRSLKEQMPSVPESVRLGTLADFWTTEVRYWRGLGETDSKEELQNIGNAMLLNNPSNAHRHMKMWFDKIQMWIMGPSNLFETLFQKEIIYNKPFVREFFPGANTDDWVGFWRDLRLQSLKTLEDM
eukprot:Phypoly_transcript_14319.p1 GENE.Phypoly_transcript_14319~~Phypoly_transcript_14319.p1  ORF type:complete len:268 (+),score=30.41 Phypoly_transcript_14319:168-971(+)